MIHESWFWKRELADLISELKTWGPRQVTQEEDWREESYFRLERSVFYSAMIVRRLIDSHKVTDRLAGRSFGVETVASRLTEFRAASDAFGDVDILKYFEFQERENSNFTAYKIASEILHSFTLEFIVDDAETDVASILVASERNQFVRAVEIPRSTWLNLLNLFIDDEVQRVSVEKRNNGKPPLIKIE